MSQDPDFLCFRRVDPDKNMARFYVLSLEPTLFGETALVRCWGRIGTRGQRKSVVHADRHSARAAFLDQIRRRIARGYSQS